MFQRTFQPTGGPRSVKRVTGAGQVVCPFRPQQKRESRKTDQSKVPQRAGAPGSHIPVCFPDFCFSLCLRVMLSLSRLRFSWKILVCFLKYTPELYPQGIRGFFLILWHLQDISHCTNIPNMQMRLSAFAISSQRNSSPLKSYAWREDILSATKGLPSSLVPSSFPALWPTPTLHAP